MSKPLKTNECGDLFQTAFEALNKQADPENFDPANAKKLFKQLASVVSGGEKGAGVRALDKWRNMSVLNKAFDIVNEFRVGAMLSGFKTQIISPISAAGTMYFRALETYLGAQLQVVFLKGDALKDARYIRSAAGEELKQMTRTLFNFKATMGAYKQMGEHPFTGLSQLEAQNVTSSASMAALSRTIDGKEGLLTNALQVLGHISTFSGQTLTRGDTTMKLVAGSSRFYSDQVYRQLKAGRSLSEATQLAHDHTTALLELKGSAKQKLMLAKELMDEGQSMPPELQEQMLRLGIKDNKDIDRVIDDLNLARENSESVTFTTALDKPTNTIEKLGRIAQKGHKEIPAVRMFLPFVRTPTNIASETWERTVGNMLGAAEAPFRMLQKRLRKGDGDELGEAWSNMQKKMESPDPRVRSEALGRMAAAVTTMGAVWSVLSEDDGSGLPSITGSGPKDAGIIKSWKMSGWQPRSIRVGDSYISYDRFDPFAGALLGFVADIRDTMALTSDDGTIGEEASAMVLGLTVALANNITSKTWMKGARDLIDLSTGRVEKAEFAYQSVASSFVPSIVNDLNRLSGDPVLRDVDGWLEGMKARVPGLSNTVDKRRNVLGEEIKYAEGYGEQMWNVIMPFQQQRIKDSAVDREFIGLQHSFSMPRRMLNGTIDLKDTDYDIGGQSAYDRLLQLSGEVTINGKTLRQTLRETIKKESYLRKDTMDIAGETNPRAQELSKQIRRYRKKAMRQLRKENPTLRAAEQTDLDNKRARRAGLGIDL